MFRISLILGVFVALICAGTGAADGPADRPDAHRLPDSADIHSMTPAPRAAPSLPQLGVDYGQNSFYQPIPPRPDDRGDRFTPGASSEPAVVIRADGSGTTSFDWFAALVGGLTVGGLALAMGGLLVLRDRWPTPAR